MAEARKAREEEAERKAAALAKETKVTVMGARLDDGLAGSIDLGQLKAKQEEHEREDGRAPSNRPLPAAAATPSRRCSDVGRAQPERPPAAGPRQSCSRGASTAWCAAIYARDGGVPRRAYVARGRAVRDLPVAGAAGGGAEEAGGGPAQALRGAPRRGRARARSSLARGPGSVWRQSQWAGGRKSRRRVVCPDARALYARQAPELKLGEENFMQIPKIDLEADDWSRRVRAQEEKDPPPEKYSIEWYQLEAEKRPKRPPEEGEPVAALLGLAGVLGSTALLLAMR
eukprot:599346-Prymnesium_polylepis.2